MVYKTALLTLIVGLCVYKQGHAQFSLDKFLCSARSDISLNPARARMDFLKENSFNGPGISRVEFRTRSNDANLSQEDFRFRITPGNPAELKANKRYFDKQVSLLDMEYRKLLNAALFERYFIAMEHIFESNRLKNLQKKREKLQEITEMINNTDAQYELDLGDLIDAESNDLELKLDIGNARIRIDEIEYKMRQYYDFQDTVDWSKSKLMDVDEVLEAFERFRAEEGNIDHISLEMMEQENQLRAERYNIEKSESRRNIGFLQAEYDTERGNETFDHFGYQVGIRLPIVNPDKPDLIRRKLATMDDEALLNEEQITHFQKKELVVLRMEHLAKQHKDIQQKLALFRQKNYLGFQSADKTLNISDLLRLNEFYADLLNKQNNLERKIYDGYLEYLDLSGHLSSMPFRNYLTKGMPEF